MTIFFGTPRHFTSFRKPSASNRLYQCFGNDKIKFFRKYAEKEKYSCMPSKQIQTEVKTITSDVDDTTTECDADGQDQKRDFDAEEPDTGRDFEDLAGDYTGLGEMEIVNAFDSSIGIYGG